MVPRFTARQELFEEPQLGLLLRGGSEAWKIGCREVLRRPDDPVVDRNLAVAAFEASRRQLALIERVYQRRDDDVPERSARRVTGTDSGHRQTAGAQLSH